MAYNKDIGCNGCEYRRFCGYKRRNEEIHCKRFREWNDVTFYKKDWEKKKERIENEKREKMSKPFWKDKVGEDTFDSKGDDISKKEFIEKEMFFEVKK